MKGHHLSTRYFSMQLNEIYICFDKIELKTQVKKYSRYVTLKQVVSKN